MCLGKTIRGRENTCCCGCNTAFGIMLIGLLVVGQEILFFVDFWHMAGAGEWNFGIFVQFFMGAARVFFWLWMCCDSIPKRKYFLWTMIITWLVQVAVFVQIQGELIADAQNYCTKKHILEWIIESWGITCTGAIIILELG